MSRYWASVFDDPLEVNMLSRWGTMRILELCSDQTHPVVVFSAVSTRQPCALFILLLYSMLFPWYTGMDAERWFSTHHHNASMNLY